MGGRTDLALVVLWTPLLWGGQRNYWNVRMFSLKLTFLTEIRTGTLKRFVLSQFGVFQPYACTDTGVGWGLALYPRESVCFSVQGPLFQKPCFLWQNRFHGTLPSEFVFIPPQPSRHHQFFFFLFYFFCQCFHFGWKHSRSCLWRRLLLLLHARRQKWKDDKCIKYHVSRLQISKISWSVGFGSSFGGILTLMVWELLVFLSQCLSF